MKLVEQYGYVWKMSDRNFKKLLHSIARDES